MTRKLVIGNWKMNPATLSEARHIARKTKNTASRLKNTDVVICPPFIFIRDCVSKRGDVKLKVGAQSVSYEEDSAHTGEVSALMLSDIGAEFALAGHSEQRARGDSDVVVSRRVKAILEEDMKAVVCAGESVRDENGAYLGVLKDQIKGSLAGVSKRQAQNIILAYEPVWAIGAKEAMALEQIYEMSIFVKKTFADIFGQEAAMKVKVLYGGAVNFRNAADIIGIGKVDGLLVGRESVNAAGFVELLKVVDAVDR